MEKSKASTQLKNSLKNLATRQNKVTSKDLEKEVIYLSCYEIIKNRKKKSSDILSMFSAFSDSMLEIVPVTKAFTEAAMELYPDHYDHTNAIIATEAVKNNVFEDNMWEILKDYFRTKHGIDIDDDLAEEDGGITFRMTSKKQVENGRKIKNDKVELKIQFIGTNMIRISVDSIISNMKGTLDNENDMYNLEYTSSSEEYSFIIRYDSSFMPKSIVVSNNTNGLTTEYFEN